MGPLILRLVVWLGLLTGTIPLMASFNGPVSVLDALRDVLVRTVTTFLARSWQGRLEIGTLRGELLRAPVLHNVVLRDLHGTVLGRIDEIRLRYDLMTLLQGRLVVHQVDIIRPQLTLLQEPDGKLNLSRVFSPAVPPPSEPGQQFRLPFPITVERLRIEDGQGTLRLASLPGIDTVEGLQADMQGQFDQQAMTMTVHHLAGRTLPARVNLLSVQGGVVIRPSGVHLAAVRGQTEGTRVYLDGDIPGRQQVASLTLETHPLDMAEVGRLLRHETWHGPAALTLAMRGPRTALQMQGHLRAAEGQAAFDGEFDTAATPPRYRGTLTLAAFDLAALTSRPGMQSDLHLRVHAAGAGTTLQTLQGSVEVDIQPSQLSGIAIRPSGFALDLQPQRFHVRHGHLETDIGSVTLAGTVALANHSDLQVEVNAQLAPLRQLVGIDSLDGDVQGRALVEGPPQALQARGTVQANRLQWQAVQAGVLTLTFTGAALAEQPQVSAHLAAQQARFGALSVARLDAQTTYDSTARQFQFTADVQQSTAYSGQAQGTVTLAGHEQQLVLPMLRLQLPDGVWQAVNPLEAVFSPGGVRLRPLRLEHGPSWLALAGAIAGDRLHDLQLEATHLDLAAWRRVLPLPAILGDRASVRALLAGTVAAPVLQGEATLDAAAQARLPAQRIQATWQYAQQAFQGEMAVRQETREVLTFRAHLPVDLALTRLPVEQRVLQAPLTIQLEVKHPDLAPLVHWWPGLPALRGTGQGELTVQGPVTALDLRAGLQLQDFSLPQVVEHVQTTAQMTASVVPAASWPAFLEALAHGTLSPQFRHVEVRAPTVRLHLPETASPVPAVQVENLVAQADGQWTRGGVQATLRTLRFQGTAFGLPRADLTLAARLSPQDFEATHFQVRFPHSEIAGRGRLARDTQQVQLQLDLPRVRLDEFGIAWPRGLPSDVQGRMTVQGRLQAPQLAAQLRYAGGQIAVDMAAQLSERIPRYHATMRVEGVAIADLLPKAQGHLHAQLRLQGLGFDATHRRAELEVQAESQDFSLAPGLTTQLRATLEGQAVPSVMLHLRSRTADLEATGALSGARQVTLRYAWTLHDVRPLQAVLGTAVQARGSIAGDLSGPLTALQARSTIQLQEWAVANLRGKQARVTLAATALPASPQVTLSARLQDVVGPALPASAMTLQGDYKAARASLTLTVTAGPYAQSLLAGHAVLQDGTRWRLDRLRLRRAEVTWEALRPVDVQHNAAGAWQMSPLLLRHGEQTISVQGSVTAAGVVDASAQLQRVRLRSTVRVFAPEQALPDGQVTAELAVRGTLAAPQVTGTVGLTALRWQEQELGEIRARFETIGTTLSADLRWRDRTRELLQATGSVGLGTTQALDFKVRAVDVEVARLAPLQSSVLASTGMLALDLQLAGTWRQPQVYGTLTVRQGGLQWATTGERYKDVQIRLVLTGNRIDLERFSVASRSGTARLSGWVVHRGWTIDTLDVALQAEQFTAVHTPEIEAVVSAALTVQGTLQDLSTVGKVTVSRARINMSGKLWGRPADVQPWELTVEGVYGHGPQVTPGSNGGTPEVRKSMALPFLRTDVRVDMPRNVWVQGSGTAVELSGTMQVRKAVQEPFRLDGTIETVQGFASFYGKKFVVREGKVVFPGTEEINPYLDVTLTQAVANYVVAIQVGGRAKQPTLTFSSTPDLQQADIVSLIVVGKTTERLTNSEQNALSGQAQQIIGEVAASELEKILGKPLGLDTVELEASSSLGSGRVSVGRYITQDIFLSYERQFGGEGGNKVGIEYSINRRLKIKGSGSDIGESALDLLWRHDY